MKLIQLLVLLVSACSGLALASDNVVFGISPTMGPIEMERVFGRLVRIVDDSLPQKVVFRTRNSREEFLIAVNNNEFDIVLMHPFNFFYSPKRDDFLPIVRKAGDLSAVFVARDPNIRTLVDMRGKIFSMPPAKGFVYALGRQRLSDAGLRTGDYQQHIYGDFNDCLQSLVTGSAQACLTFPNLVRDFTRSQRIRFHQIAETGAIPNLVMFGHKKLAAQLPKLQQDLLVLNTTEEGRITLNLLLLDELAPVDEVDIAAMQTNKFYLQWRLSQ